MISAVEAVWDAAAERRDAAAAELDRVAPLLAGLGAEIDVEVRDMRSSLEPLRAEVAADPLARWHGGRADTWAEERLRERAALILLESELAEAATRTSDLRRFVATLLGRREELRGLLDAYKAKAARLGQAEDTDLTARYDTARDLLWMAPCDLVAAGAAVNAYQQAILAAERRQR